MEDKKKFIQIAVNNENLYALDDSGIVYYFDFRMEKWVELLED